jgi:hypothetical protein
MAAQGRFGKYGDHKRKNGLRKNRILKTRLQKSSVRWNPLDGSRTSKASRKDKDLS